MPSPPHAGVALRWLGPSPHQTTVRDLSPHLSPVVAPCHLEMALASLDWRGAQPLLQATVRTTECGQREEAQHGLMAWHAHHAPSLGYAVPLFGAGRVSPSHLGRASPSPPGSAALPFYSYMIRSACLPAVFPDRRHLPSWPGSPSPPTSGSARLTRHGQRGGQTDDLTTPGPSISVMIGPPALLV